MRTNGFLKYALIGGGGLNDDGEPVQEEFAYSDKVPCFIRSITNNSKGRYEDGKFNQYSYEVLVESSANLPLSIQAVVLTKGNVELGEFKVQGGLQETAMQRIKILV